MKSRKSSYASLAGGFRTAAAAEAAASSSSASANIPPSDADSKQRATQRSVGVESMLNPQREPKITTGRRRSAVEMHRSSPGPQPAPPTLHRTASTGSQYASYRPGPSPSSAAQPRRTLTPRSPSLRAASLSGVSPTGTIDARQSPFLASQPRRYTIEPGTAGAPPLPTQPLPPPSQSGVLAASSAPAYSTGSRLGYGFPFSATATPPLPLASGARRSTIAGIAPTRETHSESVSPTTSTASFSMAEQTPPGQRLPAFNAITGSMPGPTAGSGALPGPVGLDLGRGYAIPMSSAASAATGSGAISGSGGTGGQGTYRLLTLTTQQGPVQVPVDVQAASRVQAEKRKRNAGASARFRQRRKEKEREASSMIQRLEQQLRDAMDDVEFYRRERDLVVSVLVQNFPHGPTERLFPRPPSPRHARRQRVQRDQQEQRLEQERRQRREAEEEAEDLEAFRAAQRGSQQQASHAASMPASAPASAGPYLTRFSDQKLEAEDERAAQYFQQQQQQQQQRQYFRSGASNMPGPPPAGSAVGLGQQQPSPGYVSQPPGAGPAYPVYTKVVGMPPKSSRQPVSLPPPSAAAAPSSPLPPLPISQPPYQYSTSHPGHQQQQQQQPSLPPMASESASSSFSSLPEQQQLPPVSQQEPSQPAHSRMPKPEGGWPPGTAQ